MELTVIPAPKRVRDLLSQLLERDVQVDTGELKSTSALADTLVAVYVDDSLRMRLLVVTDLAFAAYAAAAIGLVPPSRARSCIHDGSLDPNLLENLGEVFNVMASLFYARDAPPLRLHRHYGSNEAPAADVTSLANSLGHRLNLWVHIAGYGQGQLALITV